MKTTHNRNYDGRPVGLAVRGSINNERTYRVRPGNGFYNALSGEVYQDQYTYFVPASITNAEGQDARDAFATAVANWQGFSDAEKKVFEDYAKEQNLNMSGYNYYVGLYVRENA